MNVAYRSDWKSGDAQVAGISRSPLIRLAMRSDFCRQSKNHELLAPSASDCAWSGWKAKDQRRRSRLEAECLAEFKPTADLSTYRRGKSVRTTRATALLSCSAREQRAALNMIKFLSNDRRMTIVAAGTHEALHVMRFDPQIASRFEQMEPAVWTESEELRRFVAGYLAMLPLRKDPSAIDQRFIEYLLALTDGVTGRIIDLLRRAAIDALTHKSKSVGLDQLLVAGANLPAIINQRAEFPI